METQNQNNVTQSEHTTNLNWIRQRAIQFLCDKTLNPKELKILFDLEIAIQDRLREEEKRSRPIATEAERRKKILDTFGLPDDWGTENSKYRQQERERHAKHPWPSNLTSEPSSTSTPTTPDLTPEPPSEPLSEPLTEPITDPAPDHSPVSSSSSNTPVTDPDPWTTHKQHSSGNILSQMPPPIHVAAVKTGIVPLPQSDSSPLASYDLGGVDPTSFPTEHSNNSPP